MVKFSDATILDFMIAITVTINETITVRLRLLKN